MQSQKTEVQKTPNNKEQENRAVLNLKELSESSWDFYNEHNPSKQDIAKKKLKTNTVESTELPLNPKKLNHEPSPVIHDKKRLRNHIVQRPNTIHRFSLQNSPQIPRVIISKPQPFTTINFYPKSEKQYNTFDDRSRVNEKISLFASQIKQEQRLVKSIELTRGKGKGQKQPQNKINFKTNLLRKSFFYKQVKNFLYQSFKVDGKPVEIKIDPYSTEPDTLPKKNSYYMPRQGNHETISPSNKGNSLLKKLHRYDMNSDYERKTIQVCSCRGKSNVFFNNPNLSFVNETINMRLDEKEDKRRNRGKLCMGRPPKKISSIQ